MTCSVDGTEFTVSGVQVNFQYYLVSFIPLSGNLPRWLLSWFEIKNVCIQRGKKKQTAFHLKLSSGETLDCCPFTLLPWWRQFIASTGETSVYRSLLLRALRAGRASLCCEERRTLHAEIPHQGDGEVPGEFAFRSPLRHCVGVRSELCSPAASAAAWLRGLGVDVDVRRAGLPEAGAAEEIPAAPQAFVACFWKKLVRLERFDL